MSKSLLSLISLFLLSSNLHAHQLKVFAYSVGSDIIGNVYFAGGSPVEGAEIQILTLDGTLLSEQVSTPEGLFKYSATQPVDHRIVANSRDGHIAEWVITGSEIPVEDILETAPIAATSSQQPEHSTQLDTSEEQQLANLIEQAVARQIGPLRAQLQQQQDRARFSDIAGGIGTIFGLAGLAIWWRNRRDNRAS